MALITKDQFAAIMPLICDRETSQDPDHWNPENPLYGHCAIVSLLAQDLFEGDLLRSSLLGNPDFSHMRSHYWNRFDGLEEVDFTIAQFQGKYPLGCRGTVEVKNREYLLSSLETTGRYMLLAERFRKFIRGDGW